MVDRELEKWAVLWPYGTRTGLEFSVSFSAVVHCTPCWTITVLQHLLLTSIFPQFQQRVPAPAKPSPARNPGSVAEVKRKVSL